MLHLFIAFVYCICLLSEFWRAVRVVCPGGGAGWVGTQSKTKTNRIFRPIGRIVSAIVKN